MTRDELVLCDVTNPVLSGRRAFSSTPILGVDDDVEDPVLKEFLRVGATARPTYRAVGTQVLMHAGDLFAIVQAVCEHLTVGAVRLTSRGWTWMPLFLRSLK